MDEMMLKTFQGELATQCKLVGIGSEYLDKSLSEPGRYQGDPTAYTWAALQNILVSAANISKLLWGSGPASKRAQLEAIRQPLRESVKVSDSSILNSTRLRNDFEHFDERIEKWFGGTDKMIYMGRNIGRSDFLVVVVEGPSSSPPPSPTKFGHFDPQTGIVEFWDNSADIRAIVKAVHELSGRLAELPELH